MGRGGRSRGCGARRRPAPRARAFTLIELLLVLLIIAIILAIAVPFLLRSRVAANETDAIGGLKAIISSEAIYLQENKIYGTLAQLRGEGMLAHGLGDGNSNGYLYKIFLDPTTYSVQWYAEAVPEKYHSTGISSFYVDESGVIRLRDTGGNTYALRSDAETWTSMGN